MDSRHVKLQGVTALGASDHPEWLRLYLHDYGVRGVSSFESAALGGIAHLVNFDQTDTVPAYLPAIRLTVVYNF